MSSDNTDILLNSQNIVSPEAGRLLEQLVKQVETAGFSEEQQEAKSIKDHVIFESCIDGLQYQLICFSPKGGKQINLSPRELEIARLIAQGLPNKCIGKTLSVSSHTVSTHIRRIFAKLNVTCRALMVARLMEENIL